jgi:hypothetical protein
MEWLRNWWDYRVVCLWLRWLNFQLVVERENLRQARLKLLKPRGV